MTGRDPRELAGAWARHQRHTTTPPAPAEAVFVERYWTVDWSYDPPYRQKIVPYPQVHVTVRPGEQVQVTGVASRHVERELAGAGRIVGAAFRAGAFRPFLDAAVSTLTDRTVPAAAVPGLGPSPAGLDDAEGLQGWLRGRLPAPDPAGAEAGDLVALVAADPGLTRVDALAAVAGCSVRRLQRLFAEHVGVSPKWVLRRYRLHEVTGRMEAGGAVDWAGLAADLGYADQAHLSRDFAGLFGEPPTAYARRYPSRADQPSA